MSDWGSADFGELVKLQQQIEQLEKTGIDEFCRAASKELAARLLAYVIPRTPVGKKPAISGTVRGKRAAEKTEKHIYTVKKEIFDKYWSHYMGGELRRGWTAKTAKEAQKGSGISSARAGKEYAKSLKITKSGSYYVIAVKNPVPYASYVEFGHRRKTTEKFVPALGKKLKTGWVNGQYFMTISEENLRLDAPKVIERLLKEFLDNALGGIGNG